MAIVILRLERMVGENGHGSQQQSCAQYQHNLPGCHLYLQTKSAHSLPARILAVRVAMSSGAVSGAVSWCGPRAARAEVLGPAYRRGWSGGTPSPLCHPA